MKAGRSLPSGVAPEEVAEAAAFRALVAEDWRRMDSRRASMEH